MVPNDQDISAFFSPALCAINKNKNDGVVTCERNAGNVCSGCNLVQVNAFNFLSSSRQKFRRSRHLATVPLTRLQYCSKECQAADWVNHKPSCRSALMKDTWKPDWVRVGRDPTFITASDAPFTSFGTQGFLWGNMPAIDILNIKDNEGEAEVINQDLALLFAASGDLRNVVKSIAGLPETYHGECSVVMNDKQFVIVARNVIMLLVALKFDTKAAVPMMIHIWYSAALPRSMVDALESRILVLIEDVCSKIRNKPSGSLQAKTFAFKSSTLRVVLKKEEWFELAKYLTVPKTLTLEKSQNICHRTTLAPERIDYRERAMLLWSGALRVVDSRFRNEGILLPYGCSRDAFDTPNP